MKEFWETVRRPLAEGLILLLQVVGFVLVLLGLWSMFKPLGLLFAGGCAFYLGRLLWQELQRETEDEYR